MKIFLFLFIIASFPNSLLAVDGDSCACPEIQCDPCKEQVNIKFYSEKCNGGKSVKSCKKPICKMKEPISKICHAKFPTNGKSSITRNDTKVSNEENIEEELVAEKKLVGVKSTTKKVLRSVGRVVGASGRSWIYRAKQNRVKVKIGLKVFAKDIFETEDKSKIKVVFKDKNILRVTPNTKIQIAALDMSPGSESTLLDLVYGKIRNTVNKHYKGEGRYYRVRTKAAVAGVRGTDFVTSYSESGDVEMKIETIKGKVALAPRLDADDQGDLLERQKMGESLDGRVLEVPKGTFAKFVIDEENITSDVFTHSDIKEFVSRGYMDPVHKLTVKELKLLEKETGFFADEGMIRKIANTEASKYLCTNPEAEYNQCMWKCPKGHECFRKRCNASGKWSEMTRMPASFRRGYDGGQRPKVGECDY